MITPKELRLNAIPELIGMILLFLYCKLDLPYFIKYSTDIEGNTHQTTAGFTEFYSDLLLNAEWIGWTCLAIFILIVAATVAKGFMPDKPIVPLFHSYAANFLLILSFILIAGPLILWIANSIVASSRPFPYNARIIFLPHQYAVLLGIYSAIVSYFSYKKLLRFYGKYPKRIKRMVSPFLTQSWLERHYGKSESETAAADATPSPGPNRPAKPVTGRKLIWGGIAGIVLLSIGLSLYLRKSEGTKPIEIPAIRETLYEGVVGNAKVKMVLAQYGDTLSGTYSYENTARPLDLKGIVVNETRYLIDEYENGKATGTFDLHAGEYDGHAFLEGKWDNVTSNMEVYLNEKASRILPSSDADHPFVGEWETAEDAQSWAYVQLGLYNKDIEGKYASIRMPVEGTSYQLSVDSVLQLDGHDAVLLVTYGTESQCFTLHYSPSDQSLRIETEKWGTYHLFIDHRNLIERLEAPEEPQPNTEETDIPVPESPDAEELETIEDVPAPVAESPSDIQFHEPELSQAPSETTISTEDLKKEEEKARLKAQLEAELEKEKQKKSTENANKIYDKVESAPEYPGGIQALSDFISRNMRYPSTAEENGTQGKVMVSFVIDTDGSVTNARISRSVDPFLDKEALRLVRAMPRWKPGMQKGKPVKVRYTLPINFRLE